LSAVFARTVILEYFSSFFLLCKLEVLARGKPSSLLLSFLNYERKKFYNIGHNSLPSNKIIGTNRMRLFIEPERRKNDEKYSKITVLAKT
jgi:hypothetical protein